MSNGALIIGGSLAGLQAALDLADAGIQVHLIESAPFLKCSSNQPTDTDGKALDRGIPPHLLNTRLLEVSRHPNVMIHTQTELVCAEGKQGEYQVELRQQPRFIDLNKCTACGKCITVCPVTVPANSPALPAHQAIYLDTPGSQPGCMVIDKAGKSPCANTCPAGIHVQGYVALAAQGRFQEAIDLIRQAMPFPSVCGRVCNHQCEANCTRGKLDQPVNIMALKRFLADWEYAHR